MKLEITIAEIREAILDYYNKKLKTDFNDVDFCYNTPVRASLIKILPESNNDEPN
jgi:hypothetical protein